MKEFLEQNEDKITELKNFIKENNNDKRALISILHKAQEIFGYLPKELQQFIANEINIPSSKVYGVVTFYSFFNTEKKVNIQLMYA